jgi:hypothetical protein
LRDSSAIWVFEVLFEYLLHRRLLWVRTCERRNSSTFQFQNDPQLSVLTPFSLGLVSENDKTFPTPSVWENSKNHCIPLVNLKFHTAFHALPPPSVSQQAAAATAAAAAVAAAASKSHADTYVTAVKEPT